MRFVIAVAALVVLPSCSPKDRAPNKTSPYQTREHCLKSPWIPTEFGEQVHTCGNEREFVFVHAGERADPELTTRMFERHGEAWASLDGVTNGGVGLCCIEDPQWKGQCVRLEVELCSIQADALFAELSKSLESDPGIEIAFKIDVKGHAGPRCTGGPSCGPVAYSGKKLHQTNFQREGIRKVVKEELGSGVCRHDGDCVQNGCGNHCSAWTEPWFVATCESYDELEPAFCGCVQRSCAWFTQ